MTYTPFVDSLTRTSGETRGSLAQLAVHLAGNHLDVASADNHYHTPSSIFWLLAAAMAQRSAGDRPNRLSTSRARIPHEIVNGKRPLCFALTLVLYPQ